MARSRLSVYVYWQDTALSTLVSQDVSDILTGLTFSSLAPGGFGTLSGAIRFSKLKVPHPQFSLFGRVVVYSRGAPVWLGELVSPAYGFDAASGDYVTLNALGIGNGLRDDPNSWSYSGQTAQFIAKDQMDKHLTVKKDLATVLSTDYSQLFPDNPGLTINQAYDERTCEEILADIALQAGDYNWGTEADPLKTDPAGYPLGRVFIRARDLATITYSASILAGDVVKAEFTPIADRAYNQIQIDYANGTNGVAHVRATDTRINSDLSQGTAPFRFRKYLRDYSGYSLITSSVASSIAATYLALFQNVTYQGSMTLRAVRDAQGAHMPLCEVKAGYNIFIPEMAIQTTTLPTAATQNNNLFWITNAVYHDDQGSGESLDLTLGYIPNTPDIALARLQMVSDAEARSGKVTNIVQKQGAQLQGYYGFDFSNAVGGQNVGVGVTFQGLASGAPTSLTLSPAVTTNVSGLAATNINAVGAHIGGTATAGGSGSAIGSYVTVGNCLRAVNHETGRLAKHCDGCGQEHADLEIARHAYIHTGRGRRPGVTGLAIACPACGAIETYNTALTVADEAHEYAFRAQQARLIRQLMVAMGLERA